MGRSHKAGGNHARGNTRNLKLSSLTLLSVCVKYRLPQYGFFWGNKQGLFKIGAVSMNFLGGEFILRMVHIVRLGVEFWLCELDICVHQLKTLRIGRIIRN